MMRSFVSFTLASVAGSVKLDTQLALPSLNNPGSQDLPADAAWTFTIDHRQFFTPPETSRASKRISDYYYAYGHEDAITDEARARRVASEGRWHVFHMPEGRVSMGLPEHGDRRHALSALIQMSDGVELRSRFPPYRASSQYRHPLDEAGRAAEKAGAAALDVKSVKAFYDGVVGTTDDKGYKTRSYKDASATKHIVSYLQQQFESLGLTVCLHTFSTMGGKLTNVVGYLPGQGSGSDSVTVGAHYDSRPFFGNAPGAEDNGSGVAAMLSVLKAFRQSGHRPRKNVYFVGFAAEEPGLIGSDAFARELQNRQSGIPQECRLQDSSEGTHQAIAIDEVGWRTPIMAEPTVNLESYDTSREVLGHLAAASDDINGGSLKVTHSSNPFGSDHMSWLDRGMKASLVINADDEAYPGYHKSTDTMENVTPEYTVLISKMILGGFMRMAA